LFLFSHLLALTLAEEDKAFGERTDEWEKYKAQQLSDPGTVGAAGSSTGMMTE
jgi:hypothetical protein